MIAGSEDSLTKYPHLYPKQGRGKTDILVFEDTYRHLCMKHYTLNIGPLVKYYVLVL